MTKIVPPFKTLVYVDKSLSQCYQDTPFFTKFGHVGHLTFQDAYMRMFYDLDTSHIKYTGDIACHEGYLRIIEKNPIISNEKFGEFFVSLLTHSTNSGRTLFLIAM